MTSIRTLFSDLFNREVKAPAKPVAVENIIPAGQSVDRLILQDAVSKIEPDGFVPNGQDGTALKWKKMAGLMEKVETHQAGDAGVFLCLSVEMVKIASAIQKYYGQSVVIIPKDVMDYFIEDMKILDKALEFYRLRFATTEPKIVHIGRASGNKMQVLPQQVGGDQSAFAAVSHFARTMEKIIPAAPAQPTIVRIANQGQIIADIQTVPSAPMAAPDITSSL